MTKLTILRLVFAFTSVLVANVVLFAQSPSDANQKTFHIGVKGVFDKFREIELYGADFKLVNTLTDSVIRSGKASQQWEEHGHIVKTSSFKINDIPFQGHYKLILSCPGYEESYTEIDGTSLDPKYFHKSSQRKYINTRIIDLKL